MKRRLTGIVAVWMVISLMVSCMRKESDSKGGEFTGKRGEVQLIVLAPGHFHANLLQKSDMPQVNDTVFVYAKASDAGLAQYLSAIESFNHRVEEPTSWKLVIYTGDDYLDRMTKEKRGNVVVLAGNNGEKTEYILHAVDVGLNVLSDKPMAITKTDFHLLEEAYARAEERDVMLYDMMTERYELMNVIEKMLINSSDFFGELQKGSSNEPAVYMESVHHFYKEVSGAPLTRPAWYYDTNQQGEGIADVTTHLIDQLFWKCFSDQIIDYRKDISAISSTRWPTVITPEQFTKSTGENSYPQYLIKDVDSDSLLHVYANGTIHFSLHGHSVGLKVEWNWQAPEGGGDTFASEIKGTKAILKTSQGEEQGFVKQLYAQKPEEVDRQEFEKSLQGVIDEIREVYPFVSFKPTTDKDLYLIDIPVAHRTGHESHFNNVAESFFSFLVSCDMPKWEQANTMAKYYITTTAVEVAKEAN